jgi:uncharacterized damage-inducible protein DinB
MDTKGLAQYTEGVYTATVGLIKMIPEGKLDWKPADENNWMTVAQLLEHLHMATGFCMNGFINDTWPDMPHEDMLPTAEKCPAVASIEEALEKLDADRKLAADLLANLSEEDFQSKMVSAPWDPTPKPLWLSLLNMVEHQVNHKASLFAYLKLMGVKVNTMHLYGM